MQKVEATIHIIRRASNFEKKIQSALGWNRSVAEVAISALFQYFHPVTPTIDSFQITIRLIGSCVHITIVLSGPYIQHIMYMFMFV